MCLPTPDRKADRSPKFHAQDFNSLNPPPWFYQCKLRSFVSTEPRPCVEMRCDDLTWSGRHSQQNTLGSYALTLVDSLDSLALMGNATEFERSVRWICQHLSFDINDTVSVFETNIRVMGGLLSAHLLAADPSNAAGVAFPGYQNGLLRLAHDLGSRLLPAFDTPTGIPYGAVNLRRCRKRPRPPASTRIWKYPERRFRLRATV